MSIVAKAAPATSANVEQAVPFFWVTDITKSLHFYVDGLGFQKTKEWIDEGQLRWCWLQLGGAALMLQEYRKSQRPSEKLGAGTSVCFTCKDALAIYREAAARGLQAREPFVGNGLWVVPFDDPDGYRIEFASPTDVPEETKLSEWESAT
jgi:lactoylglutathione lyase